ncbi:hypothetical protein ACHAWC_002093 [Mediolabrus comicus]
MPPKVRVKIPVHVLVYSIGFMPAAAYAYHWYKNAPTDEQFEKELSKNYSQNIQSSRDKHVQMTQFLQNMKDPDKSVEQQQRMQEVLLGGRGQQKRLYAVDDSIYGTEEGAKLQKEAVMGSSSSNNNDGIIKKKRMKMKKKKRRKNKEGNNDESDVGSDNERTENKLLKQSVAGVLIAGTLAAGVSMLLGGGKRSQ